jgi:fucose 4-O-acetylase-like acetyltransferase
METTKPRTVNSIGMFDMLKGAGMLAIVLGHTAELYPLQLEGGLSLTAFVGFIYRETLMAAFFIASGYGFRKLHQQVHPPAAQKPAQALLLHCGVHHGAALHHSL